MITWNLKIVGDMIIPITEFSNHVTRYRCWEWLEDLNECCLNIYNRRYFNGLERFIGAEQSSDVGFNYPIIVDMCYLMRVVKKYDN